MIEEMKQQLKEQGLEEIYLWEDKPNYIYEKHSHNHDTKLIILSGSIEIKKGNSSYFLKQGDSILIKENEVHEAKVGENGGKYLVAEGKLK